MDSWLQQGTYTSALKPGLVLSSVAQDSVLRRVWGLMLCGHRLEIWNTFVFEFVFCKWNMMERRSTHQGLEAWAHKWFCLPSASLDEFSSTHQTRGPAWPSPFCSCLFHYCSNQAAVAWVLMLHSVPSRSQGKAQVGSALCMHPDSSWGGSRQRQSLLRSDSITVSSVGN